MFSKPSLPLVRVVLPSSSLSRLAMLSPERFVGLDYSQCVLVCFDLEGQRIWERKVTLSPFSACCVRVAQNHIWLDCGDRILTFDFDGNERPSLMPPLRENEAVGQFVVGANDVAVSLYRDLYQHPDDDEPELDLSPRVMRLGTDGKARWTTDLPVERLEFGGLGSASAATHWEVQPKAAWRPRSWKSDVYVNDGLLLSGNILLASYIEISSGIGFSYALRWSDGQLLWTTGMCPYSRRGIYQRDSFVLSTLGYGDSRTFVLIERGKKVNEWKQSGSFCVSAQGEIHLAEQGQTTTQRCHSVVLESNGNARTGASLGSHTGSQPALSEDGSIFWRDGELLLVDSRGRKNVLNAEVGDKKSSVSSRMLLDEQGTLVFTTAGSGAAHEGNIESVLWIARDAVAPLAQTPWPCGEGNPQANPVWDEHTT